MFLFSILLLSPLLLVKTTYMRNTSHLLVALLHLSSSKIYQMGVFLLILCTRSSLMSQEFSSKTINQCLQADFSFQNFYWNLNYSQTKTSFRQLGLHIIIVLLINDNLTILYYGMTPTEKILLPLVLFHCNHLAL